MKNILLAAFSCVLLSSCYTYRIYPSANASEKIEALRRKAIVLNPELKREYDILYKSNIFDLTEDSSDESAVKIRLQPLDSDLGCGQGGIVTIVTLGQLPSIMADRYYYRFEEITADGVDHKKIGLRIAQVYWFWHIFVFKKNFTGKAGKLLSMEYY